MDDQQNNNLINSQKTSFWDFRNKKIYISAWQRILDFFIGVCASFIIYMVAFFLVQPIFRSFLPYLGNVFLAFGIKIIILLMAFVYFLKRRRYIFWGLLLGYLIWIFIFKAL